MVHTPYGIAIEAHLGHSEQFLRILLNMESQTGPLPRRSAGPGSLLAARHLTLFLIVLSNGICDTFYINRQT